MKYLPMALWVLSLTVCCSTAKQVGGWPGYICAMSGLLAIAFWTMHLKHGG